MDQLVLKGILNLRLKAMGHLSILHAFSSSYASAGTEPELDFLPQSLLPGLRESDYASNGNP